MTPGERATAEREAQQLPPTVTEATLLDSIAVLLSGSLELERAA
jgi:hypothetical protein